MGNDLQDGVLVAKLIEIISKFFALPFSLVLFLHFRFSLDAFIVLLNELKIIVI